MGKERLTVKTWMPFFSGFYNTYWDFSDSEFDCEFQYINERREENGKEELSEFPDYTIDWNEVYKKVGKHYCQWIQEKFKEYEFDISIEFEEIRSPKFYNFETDSINCIMSISVETWDKIKNYLFSKDNIDPYSDYLENHYKSYSGFMSFYPYDFESWKERIEEREFDELKHEFGSIVKFLLLNLTGESEYDIDLECYYDILDYNVSEYITYDNISWDELIGEIE